MKVLFVTSYFPPIAGGSAVVYHNLCRFLNEEANVLTTWRHYIGGHEINGWKEFDSDQVFPIKRIELLRPVIKDSPPRHILESVGRILFEDLPLRLRVLSEVLSVIKKESVDIVCLGELYALSWLAAAIKRMKNLPCIFYIHGEEITTSSMSRFYGRGAMQTLGKADAVITVSNFTREEVVKRGIAHGRVHVISNGVDFARFQKKPDPDKIIHKYGLGGLQNNKVLLTVGRVEKRKGHDLVIKALPMIQEKVPNVIYIIVGIGSDELRLRQLCQQYQVTDRVVFTGLVPDADLVSFYHACDVFVMPNRTLENGDTEGFGLVFLEANACGKPVIGGNAGGVPDAVHHNKTGILVDGNSRDQFAESAIRLLTDSNLADRLGQNGYQRVQNLDWSTKAAEFRSICQQVLQ